MFVAHFPAGYLLSRTHGTLLGYAPWIMAGSVLPDADLMWCYFIDNGTVHHHSYLTHRPFIWLTLMLLGLALCRRPYGLPLATLSLGGMLHMVLDSVAGAIAWGWPLITTTHPWVVVPATQDWWVLSFLLHWTFAVEGLICLCAGLQWWRSRCTGPAPQ